MEGRLNPQNSIFSALSSECVTALIFRLDFNNRQCLYLNKQKILYALKTNQKCVDFTLLKDKISLTNYAKHHHEVSYCDTFLPQQVSSSFSDMTGFC